MPLIYGTREKHKTGKVIQVKTFQFFNTVNHIMGRVKVDVIIPCLVFSADQSRISKNIYRVTGASAECRTHGGNFHLSRKTNWYIIFSQKSLESR